MKVRIQTAVLYAAVAVTTAAAVVAASAARTSAAPGPFGPWGLDLTAFDKHVKAGDDFFAYANGSWLAKAEIPSDQPSTSAARDVYNLTQDQLRA